MSVHYRDDTLTLLHGDALTELRSLADGSVNCCVTSPPYFGLRDYGQEGQYGMESSPSEYVENMRALFAEVRRVLADDGTLFLNLGDSYSTGKQPSAGGSPCGMDGTALAGCQGGDCPSTCRCDGHQACVAASSHTARSDTPPARGSGPCASDPSLDRKGSRCSCPDGLDSTRPSLTPQSSRATCGQQQTPTPARAQPLAYPESTPAESSQPHLAECSRSDSRECAQREPRSYVCDAPRCGRSWVCTCGTSQPSDSSADRRMGKESSGSAWGESTIKFLPAKNLMGIPWRVAFALQDDGWILRSDIIWHKGNAMPESVTDRVSNRHEHMFMLTKSRRYWFDIDAIAEPSANSERPQYRRAQQIAAEKGITEAHIAAMRAAGMTDAGKAQQQDGMGKNTPEVIALATEAKAALGGYYREFLTASTRNPGDVWTIPTQPFPGAHFAVMAPELARRAVVAGCKPGGTVLDPFSGSGTTGLVAQQNGRRYVGIDLSRDYLDLSLRTRLNQGVLNFEEMGA